MGYCEFMLMDKTGRWKYDFPSNIESDSWLFPCWSERCMAMRNLHHQAIYRKTYCIEIKKLENTKVVFGRQVSWTWKFHGHSREKKKHTQNIKYFDDAVHTRQPEKEVTIYKLIFNTYVTSTKDTRKMFKENNFPKPLKMTSEN